MPGPLDGIRVIEATTMITGPLATMILGDQGADVIKLESPGIGDVMRYLGTKRGGMSTLWALCNRSKRSVVVDLKSEGGLEVVRKLAADNNIDLELVPGTGDGGRITRKDVSRYIDAQRAGGARRRARWASTMV